LIAGKLAAIQVRNGTKSSKNGGRGHPKTPMHSPRNTCKSPHHSQSRLVVAEALGDIVGKHKIKI
jgi:hypothetical protein